ncbi:AAA family ATPase [Bradyrhizobium sp. LA6.12]|uniref:AAA family ATPase n=1 Tax=unclassified Bradyrhizobium TaxID=2631580 RepID=UPI0033950712
MTARSDWKDTLAKQLSALSEESWLDYQSSPTFRRAWSTAGVEQVEMVAWIERQIANTPPDREQFIHEFCDQLAWYFCALMSPGLINIGQNAIADAVLDGFAAALGSIPEFAESKREAIRRLTEVTDHFPLMLETLAKNGREEEYISFVASDKLAALLAASPLGDGYLLPLLSVAITLLAAFGQFERDRFNMQANAFITETLKSAGLRAFAATNALTEVASRINQIGFERPELLRGEQIIRTMREAVTSYEGHADPRQSAKRELVQQKAAASDSELAQALAELNEMIGLDAVKREIISLTNFIKVQRLRAARNLKQSPISLHLVFSGSPGTGKTTVARIVAKLYKALGILSSGHLVETDRSGLVVGYVGQTATNTKKVIESALNGVLFIDEAYSLVKDAPWDFGPEAIETLLKLMEDNRDRLVVIVAGYSDPMAAFIASNPGLQSRFTRRIEFEDYSADKMLHIFEKRAAEHGFRLTPAAADALLKYFSLVEGDDGFGNGRGVRNTFERATVRHADRIAALRDPGDYDLTTLTEADVDFSDSLLDDEMEIWGSEFAQCDSYELDLHDRVFHQKFGYGKIVSIDGNKLLVDFERAGTKAVVNSFVERA